MTKGKKTTYVWKLFNTRSSAKYASIIRAESVNSLLENKYFEHFSLKFSFRVNPEMEIRWYFIRTCQLYDILHIYSQSQALKEIAKIAFYDRIVVFKSAQCVPGSVVWWHYHTGSLKLDFDNLSSALTAV